MLTFWFAYNARMTTTTATKKEEIDLQGESGGKKKNLSEELCINQTLGNQGKKPATVNAC